LKIYLFYIILFCQSHPLFDRSPQS